MNEAQQADNFQKRLDYLDLANTSLGALADAAERASVAKFTNQLESLYPQESLKELIKQQATSQEQQDSNKLLRSLDYLDLAVSDQQILNALTEQRDSTGVMQNVVGSKNSGNRATLFSNPPKADNRHKLDKQTILKQATQGLQEELAKDQPTPQNVKVPGAT